MSGHRLQLEFDSEAWDTFQEIKQLTNCKTNAGTIREGLRVLGWLIKQENDGWKLQLVKENTVRAVDLDLKAD